MFLSLPPPARAYICPAASSSVPRSEYITSANSSASHSSALSFPHVLTWTVRSSYLIPMAQIIFAVLSIFLFIFCPEFPGIPFSFSQLVNLPVRWPPSASLASLAISFPSLTVTAMPPLPVCPLVLPLSAFLTLIHQPSHDSTTSPPLHLLNIQPLLIYYHQWLTIHSNNLNLK